MDETARREQVDETWDERDSEREMFILTARHAGGGVIGIWVSSLMQDRREVAGLTCVGEACRGSTALWGLAL